MRSERITETIRRAFEDRTLEKAPRELVEELLATAQEFAAIAPRDFASVVARGEKLIEQLLPYLCSGCEADAAARNRQPNREKR